MICALAGCKAVNGQGVLGGALKAMGFREAQVVKL